MTDSPASASICPLCGEDNQCAVAAGRPPESCWCRNVTLSGDAKSRAADATRKRCLCPACGQPTDDDTGEG